MIYVAGDSRKSKFGKTKDSVFGKTSKFACLKNRFHTSHSALNQIEINKKHMITNDYDESVKSILEAANVSLS